VPAYLISGPAGSGKSLVSRTLANRGYRTFDTDSDALLSGYYSLKDGAKVPRETVDPITWHRTHLWRWDKERMRELFDENRRRTTFFCGTAHNEAEFFDWFAARFALITDIDSITARVQQREPEVWANGSDRLAALIKRHTEFLDYSHRFGMTPIEASQSPHKVADDILAAIGHPRPHYLSVKSFIDEEAFPCARPLKTDHIAQDCVLLHDRFEMIKRLPKGAKAAEIGVQSSAFTRHILATSDPLELHLLVSPFGQRTSKFDSNSFASEIARGRVAVHEGDSSLRLKEFPDAYFDWIYVDADHSHQGAHSYISLAVKKMRADGQLLLHNYTAYSPLEKMQYGVQLAANDLLAESNFEIAGFALGDLGYHDVCLRRKQAIR
jgi:hypothetical protein